jgi:hypothetical protein
MNALASRIAEQLLSSDTRIGPLIPCQWADDIKAAVPDVLGRLADQVPVEVIDDFTDRQIGEAFRDAVRNETGQVMMTAGHDVTTGMGRWLRAAVKADMGDTVPESVEYPAVPRTPRDRSLWHSCPAGHLDALRIWANNDTDDVKDGVDEQATALLDMAFILPGIGQEWVPWGADRPFTTGEAKDFLGAVMRYKKARLAAQTLGEPVSEYLTERPTIGTRFRITERSKGTAYLLNVGEEAEASNYSNHNEDVVWAHTEGAPDWTDGMSGRWVTWTDIRTDDLLSVVEEDEESPEIHTGVPIITQAQWDEAQAERERLRDEVRRAHANHESDIEKIGERLIAESKSRSWCSEYDTIIEDLNSELNVALPARETDVDVTVSGYIRVPFSVTVSVSRSSDMDDDDVEREAMESVEGNYSASDLYRSYGDSYSAEVEEDMEASID